MFTKSIVFENFKKKKIDTKIRKNLNKILKDNNEVIKSLQSNYKNSYTKKILKNLKKYNDVNIIGMGGSILGARAIYSFLDKKFKKKFFLFFDNLQSKIISNSKKKKLNLIISKSGNTLETISNANILIKKKDQNLFITENKDSNLMRLANKLKADIIHHNNYIGGRYSVLSEVGMLPAELMGFKLNKFKRLNYLIKNKNFLNSLVLNVSNTINLVNQKKFNSIILNYDERSSDLFYWYQQLIAESLGKKNKGILPMISLLPRDNHSLMQLYLDGFKNNFFTFFFVKDSKTNRVNNSNLPKSYSYIKGKSMNSILEAQFNATKNVFRKKNIPFRSFYLNKRNEESLGELFTFFILETILLGMAMKVNPYNQPAVELVKDETKKNLI
tara:strand:+ start:234 stop:1391 length:1158 start_codon:yes stop_codon:yes gene_type:complete